MNFNIDTNVIIALAGGICSISAAYVVVKKSIKGVTDKVRESIKKELKDDIKRDVVDPMYKQALEQYKEDFKLITNHLDSLTEKLEEQLDEQKELNDVAHEFRISTLKGLIVQSHSTFTQLGKIEPMVLATLEDIYKTYKDIGGNHFIDDLMEEIRDLSKESKD